MKQKEYLKSRLEEIKKSMTEEQFFSSVAFLKWMRKMVLGLTGRVDLKLLLGKGLPTATDNKTIWTDTSFSKEEEKLSLVDKVLMIIGSVAHEIFHCIYTDFTVFKKVESEKLRHHFLNIVEDSAIEYIGCAFYSGWSKVGLEMGNVINFKQRPSLSELNKKGALRADIYTEACLTYAIMGKVKGRVPKSISKEFNKAMPLLDAGRLAVDTKERLYYSDRILELGKEFFKEKKDISDLLDKLPHQPQGHGSDNAQKAPQPGSSGNADKEKTQTQKNAEKTKTRLKKGQKKSEQDNSEVGKKDPKNAGAGDEGDEKSSDDKTGNEQSSAGNSKDDVDDKKEEGSGDSGKDPEGKAEDVDPDDSKDGSSGDLKDKSEEDPDGQAGSGDKDNDDSKKESDEKSGNSGKDSKEDAGDKGESGDQGDSQDPEKDGKCDNTEGEDDDSSKDSEIDYDQDLDYTPPDLSDLEESLNDLGNDIAMEIYDNAEDKKISAKIQKFNAFMSDKYGDMHRHIRVVSNFLMAGPEDKNRVQTLKAEIAVLSKALKRMLLEVIRFNESYKKAGLFSGKPNTSQLYRLDQRVFCKRIDKSDESDLCILYICDGSYSMKHGGRLKYARKAALILYDVCEALKIPYAVLGHSADSGRPTVRINHLVDWDVRSDQRANIMRLSASGNTREGVSIRYAAEYLRQRPEKDKLMIVVSDGEPIHDDGRTTLYGKPVADDIKAVIKKYRDIRIIGVAIGDGQTEIKHLYKESLEISDLSKLPMKLTNLIKANLLKEA